MVEAPSFVGVRYVEAAPVNHFVLFRVISSKSFFM
jgi:hypothetical protein